MRRVLPLLLLFLLLPAPAAADWIGFYVKPHANMVQTDRSAAWAAGGEAALQILGFEAFVDLRFLRQQPKWFWNRLGLRYAIDLPFSLTADEAQVFVDGAYVASSIPDDQLSSEPAYDRPVYKGLSGDLGLRFEWELVGPFLFGLQVETGAHMLFPNIPEATGPHAGAQGYLKLDF